MFCRECGTPGMLTYSPLWGWRSVCVKCGEEMPAGEPGHIPQEAGEYAQMGYSAFMAQDFENAEECWQQAAEKTGRKIPEYLWALLLARYGVRYCKTPINKGTAFACTVNYWKRELPQKLMAETQEYKRLSQCAGLYGSEWNKYYKAECENIDAGLQQIRELERAGEGCDIFLCFKDTDEAGVQTAERKLLDMVYPGLMQSGARVFYAPQMMTGKKIYDYEGVIYHALRTARLLVVIASTRENVQSQWVESEWMRFLSWNTDQKKRILTGTVGNMGPAQFPGKLCSIQSDLHAERVGITTAKWFASEIRAAYQAMQLEGVQKTEQRAVAQPQKVIPEPTAQELYQKGLDCKDKEEAVKWYRKAAEQGLAEAQNTLGVCYYSGDGVTQDYAEAVKWFRKAAEQGLYKAQYNLGLSYYNGHGVPQNYEEAAKWFRKAAEQEFTSAQYNLGTCCYNGYGVPQNHEEAVKWFRKAAEQGDTEAQNRLGFCYDNGEGVQQNKEEAVKWYRRAAELGLAEA